MLIMSKWLFHSNLFFINLHNYLPSLQPSLFLSRPSVIFFSFWLLSLYLAQCISLSLSVSLFLALSLSLSYILIFLTRYNGLMDWHRLMDPLTFRIEIGFRFCSMSWWMDALCSVTHRRSWYCHGIMKLEWNLW